MYSVKCPFCKKELKADYVAESDSYLLLESCDHTPWVIAFLGKEVKFESTVYKTANIRRIINGKKSKGPNIRRIQRSVSK